MTPCFATVPTATAPSTLMPLEQAASLPQLGGMFSPRDLRRYASRPNNPLPCIRPGREYLTTLEWVDAWIEDLLTCRDPASLLTNPSARTRGTGSSSTAGHASSSSHVSRLQARLTTKPPVSTRHAGADEATPAETSTRENDMHMIDTVTASEVDRDIAEGVLAAEKRAERISRRRAQWSIGIARWTPMGVIGRGGVCIEPATRFQVYLQYGSTRVHGERFEGVPVAYVLEVSCERPLDGEGIAWVVRRVEDLRRNLAPDLRVDVKHSAYRLNPELTRLLEASLPLPA